MFMAIVPGLLSTLFRLTYFVESPAPQDRVHFFVFERSVRIPYTLRSIWILTVAGYYAEAAILLRHLLETFVQMRYFTKHPSKLIGHLTGKKKDRVAFSTMFGEFSPEYYDRHYRVLCGVAHAGVALTALQGMQTPKTADGKWLTPIGCEFHPGVSSYVVNQTMMLVLGCLRCFRSGSRLTRSWS